MATTKKQPQKCHYCEWNYRTFTNDEGIAIHAVKESDGQGYDTYYYVCSNQTKTAIEAYRKTISKAIKELIKAQRETISILKGYLDTVETTKTADSMKRALEGARQVSRY